LAGRVKKIVLHPLSLGEIRSSRPKFIENAFKGKFDCRGLTKRDALLLALKGGFPESVLFEDVSNSLAWGESYLDAIIDHDLKDVANIRRLDNLKTLLRVLAAWSSKFIDKTGIMSSLSITKPTFDSYFSVLKNMFLIDAAYPWAKTDYEYASKRAKIFMSDTGLMAAALGWNLNKIELDSDKCGKLIETFVYNQLSAEINAANQKYYLSHYRDSEKREIDFLIENEDNDLLAIEIKSGSAVSKDSFKHIVWFRERMKKRFNRFVGVVLYTGDCLLPFGENLFAAPMDVLWNAS
jgi:predicted AAA+ superfamily ATPase